MGLKNRQHAKRRSLLVGEPKTGAMAEREFLELPGTYDVIYLADEDFEYSCRNVKSGFTPIVSYKRVSGSFH